LILAALFLPAGLASDQDKRALAEEMLTVTHPEKMIDQVMQQIPAMMQQQIRAMKVPEDMKPKIDRMLQDETTYMREKLDWTKLKPQFVDIYSDVFTEEELRQIVAFYKSPGGQAFLNKTPQVMQRSMALTQSLMADFPAHIQETIAKMKKEIEDKQEQAKP
jgi:hypothetical protein